VINSVAVGLFPEIAAAATNPMDNNRRDKFGLFASAGVSSDHQSALALRFVVDEIENLFSNFGQFHPPLGRIAEKIIAFHYLNIFLSSVFDKPPNLLG